MDAAHAQAALEEHDRRRRQTLEAGAPTWTRRDLGVIALALLLIGLSLDLDMVWLTGLAAAGLGLHATRSVRLMGRGPIGWEAALLLSFVLAAVADVLVQAVVRGLDGPVPNAAGAAAAALVVVCVSRPVQAELTGRRRG